MPNDKDFIVKNNARVRGGKLWLKDTTTEAGENNNPPANQQHVYLDGSDGNLTLASDNLIEFHETDGATRRVVFDCNDNKYSFGDSTSHGTTDTQSEMFHVSGSGRFTSSLNVNGSILGRVSSDGSSTADSGNSHSFLNNVFVNPSPEAGGAIDIRTVNELAGLEKWGIISDVSGFYTTRTDATANDGDATNPSYTYSNEVTSITQGTMFDGVASTAGSWFTDNGTDGTTAGTGTFTLSFAGKKQLSYTCYVGIVFGSSSFTAKKVKIEVYRGGTYANDAYSGGSWTTLCDLTTNSDVNVSRKVPNGTASGVQQIRYTLGGNNTATSTYFRVQDVYALDHDAGGNSGPKGIHYVRKYGDSDIYGNLLPATDSTYTLGDSDQFFLGVYSDKLYLNDAAATATGTSALFLDGTEVKTRTLGSLAFSSTNFLTADANDTTNAKLTLNGANPHPLEIIRTSAANSGIKFQNTQTAGENTGDPQHTAYLGLGNGNGQINIGSSENVQGQGNRITTVADKLNVFAATTSAELAGKISDETGTGALVFGTNPTLVGATVTSDFVQNTANKNFITSGKQITNLDDAWSNGVTFGKSVGIQPFRYQGDASNMPSNSTGDNANWGLNIYSHSGSDNTKEAYGLQLSGRNNDAHALYLRRSSNGTFSGWKKIWHEGSLPEATIQKRTAISSALSRDTYKRVARVTGNELGTMIRASFSGTTANVVVAVVADIIVNHSGDVHIMSQAGDYHPITIKVFSNSGNEDFDLYVKYDQNGSETAGATMTLKTVIQGLGDETVISNPTENDHAAYTNGTSHEHTTTDGGVNFTQSSGNADIVTDGDITATNFTGTASLVNVTANNSADETTYLTFTDGATGSQGLETDTALSYNPSSNLLTAGTFQGEGTVHYVEGNTSGTAGTWTGTNANIASYYNGLIVAFKHGIAGASTTTLNINTLGAKTVYRYNSSKLTTHFPVGSTINYVYDSSSDAFFAMTDIDTTKEYELRWASHITAGAAIDGYQLLMEGSDGKFYPVTSGGANANDNTVSTQTMRMGGILLIYDSATNIAADAVWASNVWEAKETSRLEHWTNHPTSEGAWGTAGGPLYLVGTENSDGHFVLDNTNATSFLAQALPTTDDGKIYIHLGYFGDTTNTDNLRFTVNHPMYQYINGQVQPYTAVPRKVTVTRQNSPVSESNLIPFVADASATTGDHGLEMSSNLSYNPNTSTLKSTHIEMGTGGGTITVPEFIAGSNPNYIDLNYIKLGDSTNGELQLRGKSDEALIRAGSTGQGILKIEADSIDAPIIASLGLGGSNDNGSGNVYLRLEFGPSGFSSASGAGYAQNYQFIVSGYTGRADGETGSLHYYRYKVYLQIGHSSTNVDRIKMKVVGDASSNSDAVQFGYIERSDTGVSNSTGLPIFNARNYLYIKTTGHGSRIEVFNHTIGTQKFLTSAGFTAASLATENQHEDTDITYVTKESDGGSADAVTLTGTQTISGTKTFTANQLMGTNSQLQFRSSDQRIESGLVGDLDFYSGNRFNFTSTVSNHVVSTFFNIESTSTGAGHGPILNLSRAKSNGVSGVADDKIGQISFQSRDSDGGVLDEYASIYSTISSPTAGDEKGNLTMEVETSVAAQPCKIDLLGDEKEIHLHAARVHLKDSQGTSYATPQLYLNRVSDTPAGGDMIGDINFLGTNLASTPEQVSFANIRSQIVDPTDASEDGKLHIGVAKAGSLSHNAATFSGDGLELTNDLTIDNKITFKGSAATSRPDDDFEFKIRNNSDTTTVMRAGPDISLSAYGYRLYDIGDTDNGSMALGINGSGNSFVYVDHVRGDASSSYKIDLRNTGAQSALPHGIKLGRSGLTGQTVQPYTSGTGNIGLSSSIWSTGHFNSLKVYDNLRFQDNDDIRFGSGSSSSDQGGDAQLGFYGTDMEMRLTSAVSNFKIKESTTAKFTFERANGNFTAAGNVTAYSDERLKSNIKTLDSSKVLQMRGVEFIKDGKKGSGVIAQEIEKIAPELVLDGDDGYKSVAYGNLTGYLIETVKEQQKQIDELKHLVQKLLEKS